MFVTRVWISQNTPMTSDNQMGDAHIHSLCLSKSKRAQNLHPPDFGDPNPLAGPAPLSACRQHPGDTTAPTGQQPPHVPQEASLISWGSAHILDAQILPFLLFFSQANPKINITQPNFHKEQPDIDSDNSQQLSLQPLPKGAVAAPGDVGAHLHPGVDAEPCHCNVEQVPHYDLTNKLESQ